MSDSALPTLVELDQAQPPLPLVRDHFQAVLLFLLLLQPASLVDDPLGLQGLLLEGEILLIFALLDVFEDLLDPAFMLSQQFEVFVLRFFELHLHLRAVHLHLN